MIISNKKVISRPFSFMTTTITDVLDVARETVKTDDYFMVTAPDLDFISFDLPYTWRSVIKEEGHMDTTALQAPLPNSGTIYLTDTSIFNKVMKQLYKAGQEGLLHVVSTNFYTPLPKIQIQSIIRCEVIERPKPPLDRTRDKGPRED
jgi:hypothetical protein